MSPKVVVELADFVRRQLVGRLALILWVVAALLAGAIGVAYAFRGTEREDVAAYIDDVYAVRAEFVPRYEVITGGYERLRTSPETVSDELRRFRIMARSMTELRVRTQRIEAPTDARNLRRKILALLRMQEVVAYELVAVVEYLPKLQAAERPVAAANASLARALRDGDVDQQVQALAEYARRLNGVAAALEDVSAPPLLATSHAAYVDELRRRARASRALETGIAAGDANALDAAMRHLRAASAAPSGMDRAQRSALGAYSARASRVRTLGLAVERERQRLEREVDS